MKTTSRVLFNSSHYVATITRAGLIVQNHRTGTGCLLPTNHPQHAEYADAIETAIDADEANSLCRALMNS